MSTIISLQTILWSALAAAAGIGLPVLVFLVWKFKFCRGAKLFPAVVGAVTFVVFAQVLEGVPKAIFFGGGTGVSQYVLTHAWAYTLIGCLLAGEDSDDIENVDIEKVRAALKELKGQLLGFWASNDEQTIPWLAGDFWAGEIWSGPYSQLINDPSTNIKLVHPTEGTVGYVDYWAIVEGTDEYDLACEWINWIESEEQQTAMATGISDKYPGEYYTTRCPPASSSCLTSLIPN